ncbi:hypothetical protein GCM10023353_12160 [Tomitella cavernea]|uniref:Peptidase M15C domain-containing protein n=1 Tax=Tomitella cavernea TaxID=1387982 RepID=A0ABP9CFI9_9ACTN
MSFRTAYGHTHSENGWRMCNRDECDIVRIPELYLTDTAPIRMGAPLTILGAWLFWYDRNVEEIVTPIWGWSRENAVATSNHLSGTAVDVNAPRYPWGLRRMPADKIAKVRQGLALFEGTVFWGADWQRADEMHYQMAHPEGDPRNEAFAAKLRAGYLGIWADEPGAATGMTTAVLAAAMGGSLSTARYVRLLPAFTAAMRTASITTVERAAMWCAQLGHESGGLRWMEEIWGPTVAQRGYEGRADLGNVRPGDGYRFHGRGPIQVTGRANYAECSRWAYEQGLVPTSSFFVDNPAALADDETGFVGAVWYWVTRGLNGYADRRDLEGATRCINGGTNGLADRRRRYNHCLALGEALLPEEDHMTAQDVAELKTFIGDFITGFVGPMGSDTKDVRAQLTGSRDLVYTTDEHGNRVVDVAASWPGWRQLGGRTLVDAIAVIGVELGIDGFELPPGENPDDSADE